ncbi:substrate-binding domain-containing protein [Curtobacterium sp. MCLR17_007]|uniref:LacI family DNA-binding transcriptional regulator n=1 Tax=Curtobacterium sp. MCLR17_007 TaxID=2175648 RepID=UPI000DAA59C7|nr:substrate-binding domain-containing protein [Curtobacterium sp. MCLR17_007]WIB60438.1 substrate-binding domain-containing protein [Curtobacterium sp. MCLR17_007]
MGLPIGLTLVRTSEIYGAEPWFHELTAGIDQVVRPLGRSVLLRVLATREDELRWLRQWRERDAVAGVVLVDLIADDPRVDLVRTIGLPAVSVSSPDVSDGLPAVWTNDDAAMRSAVRALHDLGHTSIGLVSGPLELAHTVTRALAFTAVCDELQLERHLVSGDYSTESGERAFAALLAIDEPPTAVVFDNDLMALGGLAESRRRVIAIPDEMSLVAWDDSALCQLSEPPLSALGHDVQRIGRMVGEALVAVLAGEEPPTLEAPAIEFVARESVAALHR